MPEFQPLATAHVAAIQRPGCPKCQHNRMLLAKLEAGSFGVDRGTFECQMCGHAQSMLVRRRATSAMRRWFELRLPI